MASPYRFLTNKLYHHMENWTAIIRPNSLQTEDVMKKCLLFALVALYIAFSGTDAVFAEGRVPFARITMTAGHAVITAELYDNPTTRDFVASLPVTLPMSRWGEREYYGKVKKRLSDKGPQQNGFEDGDVAYYVPGGSFAVFFNSKVNPDISHLIVMGKVTSDLSVFDSLGESVEMRIELAR